MALEQQSAKISKTNLKENVSGKTSTSFPTQLELISDQCSMKVSYFYIPHMCNLAEIIRVRKALLPFAEQLIEHSIDPETRHLTLYHQGSLEKITAALNDLNLAAELQQTLQHYEPLEMTISTPDHPSSLKKNHETGETVFNSIWQFLASMLLKIKQWMNTLQNKQDQ